MTPTIAAAALLVMGTVLCPTAPVTDRDAPASPAPLPDTPPAKSQDAEDGNDG